MVALLAYLSQSLVFAESACDGTSDFQTAHSMAMDSSGHMQHEMTPQQTVAEYGDNCCGSQCQCSDQGCNSPIPVIVAHSHVSVFGAVAYSDPAAKETFRPSCYLYKPPILS